MSTRGIGLRAAWLALTLALTGAASSQAGTGDYLVADTEANGGSGGIIEVDRNTGARTWVSNNLYPGPAFVDPWNLDNEPGGSAYYEGGDNEPSGGDRDALLVADPNAGLAGTGILFRVNKDTGERTILSDHTDAGPNLANPIDVVVAPDGTIYLLDQGIPGVLEVDPVTGNRTNVSSNGNPFAAVDFTNAIGISYTADDKIIVADWDGPGKLIEVDPVTHDRTLISSTARGAGPDFNDPGGIDHYAEGIYVADASYGAGAPGALFSVSAGSGDRTVLSENTNPVDQPDFNDPVDLDVEGSGDIVIVDESTFGGFGVGGGIIRVNPANGLRTRVTRNSNPLGGASLVVPWGILVDPIDFILVRVGPGVVLNPPRGGGIPVAFSLSEPARVAFEIERKTAKGYTTVRKFSTRGAKGTNRRPRLPGKALKRGTYRVTARAKGRSGHRSRAASTEFRVVRR